MKKVSKQGLENMQNSMQSKRKIVIIVSSPITAMVFLRHQISELCKIYDVTLVANFGSGLINRKKYKWLEDQ